MSDKFWRGVRNGILFSLPFWGGIFWLVSCVS